MPFTDRFQLLDLKRDEGARTYEAREIATGRPVYVHVFADTTAPLNRALLAKLDNLPEEEQRRIIDRGPLDVGIYVVTDRLAEYPGLREWLKAKNQDRPKSLDARGAWQLKPPAPVVPPPPPAPPPFAAPPAKADEAGEFTRLFTSPLAPPVAPRAQRPVEAVPPPVPPVSALPVAPPALPKVEQPVKAAPPPMPAVSESLDRFPNSEDTTLQVRPPAQPPPLAPQALPPKSRSSDEPTVEMRVPITPPAVAPPAPNRLGEEERSSPFDTAPLPVIEPSIAPPPPAQTPAANGPGEFTRQFAPPTLRQVEEERPNPFDTAPLPTVEPSIASPPPIAAFGNSGVQTLQMEPPPVAQPPAPAPVANEPGEFTRQFAPPVLRPVPAPKETAAPPANEPGEFTRQFARPTLRPAPAPPTPASPEPGEFTRQFVAPSAKPAAPQKTTPPPGEFTRQFQAPQRPTPPQSPKLPVPSQPAPANSESPGEFTQLLQAQRPAGPPPAAKQPSQTGEFARYFESPMTPPPQGGPGNSAPLAPSRLPSHPKDAGEFTQIFGRGDIPSAPPPQAPAAPPNPLNANATQVFAAPRPIASMPMAAPNLPQNAGPPSLHHGPGEYTQMFAKPASLTLGQAPPVQPPSRAVESVRPRNKSRLPLLLVIGAAVLLIIAGIVYFVMRQHTT